MHELFQTFFVARIEVYEGACKDDAGVKQMWAMLDALGSTYWELYDPISQQQSVAATRRCRSWPLRSSWCSGTARQLESSRPPSCRRCAYHGTLHASSRAAPRPLRASRPGAPAWLDTIPTRVAVGTA